MSTTQINHQTIKLLWYNTFLLHGFSIGSTKLFGAKPHLEARATELGNRLQKLAKSAHNHPNDAQKTIFALCEVFSPKTFALIYEQLNPLNIRYTSGPPAGLDALLATNTDPSDLCTLPTWMHNVSRLTRQALPVSSGLYTLADGLPITRTASEAFQLVSTPSADDSKDWNLLNRGHPLRDPDFWANKGILLTEFDLGPGKIELYSTHLFSGQVLGEALLITLHRLQKLQLSGVLPFPFKRPLQALLNSSIPKKISNHLEKYRQFFDLRPPIRLKIQRAQLQQLVEFIARHHRPENIVILVGDLNLDAHDPLSHAALSHAIDRLKEHGITLQDTRHGFQKSPQANSTLIPNELLFHTYAPDQIARAAAMQSAAHSAAALPGQWLDYIFVQKEEAQHTCSLKIIDQALRPFPRLPAPGQTMHFLSDHIGLELTLRASPRPS